MKETIVIGSITICLGATLAISVSWVPVVVGFGLTGAFILGAMIYGK